MQPKTLLTLALTLVPWAGACQGAAPEVDPAPEVAPPPPGATSLGPWTDAFLDPAILLADEITIEGPPALRDHLAVTHEQDKVNYGAKTTEDGFLQVMAARQENAYVEIRSTLDSWSLVAFRRLVWLERPADSPVTVRAVGRVTWQLVDGSAKRREDTLEFRGELRR